MAAPAWLKVPLIHLAVAVVAAVSVIGSAPLAAASVVGTLATGSDLCAQVGYAAGFRDGYLVTAVAVALAESGCNPSARGANGPTSGCPDGSTDRGLWQINDCYHPDVSDSCAYDPQCNANAAYRISSGGGNWTPWSTYNSGVYRNHLAEAQAAVARLGPALPRRPLCRPAVGDWDGNGSDGLGVACKDGQAMPWALMNGVYGGSPQIVGGFGNSDWCVPVTGDWDGDGRDSVGVVCRDGAGMTWSLSNGFAGGANYTFGFGNPDTCWPVTGDWTGSGRDGIGVACKDGAGMTWHLMNGPYGGSPQIVGGFGNSDLCLPVTGDWDGDGRDSVGVVCRDGAGMTWSLSNGFAGGANYTFGFGNSGLCHPVVGDWNGTSDGSRRSGIGVACRDGQGLTWNAMYGPYGGSPQVTAGFGNGTYYQPTGGWGGPLWPGWPNG